MTRTWMLLMFALNGLRRTPLRVILTSLGVAIAAGALFTMVGFAIGLQEQIEAPFEKFQLLNNIQVMPKRGGGLVAFGPERHGPPPELFEQESDEEAVPLDDDAVERIRAIPGVVVAYPDLRSADVRLVRGENSVKTLAMGLPREASLLTNYDDILAAGHFFGQETAPEIVVADSMVERLGFESAEEAVGQSVTIEASGLSRSEGTSFEFEEEHFDAVIVGVHRGRGLGAPMLGMAVMLPVDQMQNIPGVQANTALASLTAGREDLADGYGQVTVRAKGPGDVERIEREIQAMGFRTRSLMSQLDEMRTAFVFIDLLLAAVGTVALVVATLGIINTLLMSVLERYREIGIYKAMGASAGDLVTLFLAEASLIGLIGGLGGLALGYGVGALLNAIINAVAHSQGAVMDLRMFSFPAWLIAATMGYTIGMSIVAGLYPAMRAARVDPIVAIRKE